jgi:hypothetical protein
MIRTEHDPLLTLLHADLTTEPVPTVGFNAPLRLERLGRGLCFYDVGGGKRIRDVWSKYFHEVRTWIAIHLLPFGPSLTPLSPKNLKVPLPRHLMLLLHSPPSYLQDPLLGLRCFPPCFGV